MSDLLQHNKKVNVSNAFDGLINEAMDDISNKEAPSQRSFQMPVEILYLMVLLFIISFIYHQPHSSDTHLGPTTASLESGKRVTLLTFAEDIDSYQQSHNKFPEKIPSPLASVLEVQYEILAVDHYQLTMATSEGKLVLDHKGKHEDLYIGDT